MDFLVLSSLSPPLDVIQDGSVRTVQQFLTNWKLGAQFLFAEPLSIDRMCTGRKEDEERKSGSRIWSCFGFWPVGCTQGCRFAATTSLRAGRKCNFCFYANQPPIRQSYHYATCTGSIVTGVKDFCFDGCCPFKAIKCEVEGCPWGLTYKRSR